MEFLKEKKSTEYLFHCPDCGGTQFSGHIHGFVVISFRQGISLASDSKNSVWELADEEPNWDPNVTSLSCVGCSKELKQGQLLTPRQWKKRELENRITNKSW